MGLLRRSSSDVEALDRSFRSRILLLSLLCVGAIGLAAWSGMRDTGRGLAEDPRRVLVIDTPAAPGPEVYLELLERAGFMVEVEDLAGWEARALEYMADEDERGLERVVEFADLGGYGFVLLERPAEFDFGELELEPTPDEIESFAEREYAVLSVGDLAFPHRLTVDEPGEDPTLRVPGHGALQAIYGQPRLAIDREALVERPTVDELRFEDAIRFGRQLVEAPKEFPELIARVVSDETTALAQDGAKTLVEPLHTGSPLPIAGGGALLLHHELVVYSDDARTLEIDSAATLRIDWLDADALARGDFGRAVLCSDLLGGEIRLDQTPSFEVSRDGRRLAITDAREGSRVWRKLDQPGCRFALLGELPGLEPGEVHFGELAPEYGPEGENGPVLARLGRTDRGTRLRLWSTSSSDWVLGEQELLELSEVELRMPTFLDAHRIALLSRSAADAEAAVPAEPIDALHVVDRRRPASHLRIPAEFIGADLRLRDLAWLPPGDPASPWNLHVLVTTVDPSGSVRVVELALTDEVAAMLDERLASPAPAPEADAPPGPELQTITPGDLIVRDVLERDDLVNFAVAPSGRWLALVVGDPRGTDSELALLDRTTGAVQTLTTNDLRDYLPRFTDDGRQLLFSSLMQVWISGRTFTVPRVLALEPK
jgi:hypothetical protein